MSKHKEHNKNQKLSILERLKKQLRLAVVDLDSYEEIRHINFTGLGVIIYLLFSVIIVVSITWFVIAHTPLRQAIPGYPNISKQKELAYKNKRNEEWLIDKKQKLEQEHIYYKNLQTILLDSVVSDSLNHNIDSIDAKILQQNFEVSKSDSILRQKIDEKEKFLITPNESNIISNNELKGILFFSPLNGNISDSINTIKGHYGLDIIAPKNEPIKSTLNGTVIYADWTPDNGHVIHIQHAYNLVSVYKHNSVLLKKMGDYVKIGEPIAIIGNSGKLSTGPHLHFELWHKGVALDPTKYIAF